MFPTHQRKRVCAFSSPEVLICSETLMTATALHTVHFAAHFLKITPHASQPSSLSILSTNEITYD
jgi:hypothetical protein